MHTTKQTEQEAFPMFELKSSEADRLEWREQFNNRMMSSAIGEYCPEEFGILLDDLAAANKRIAALECKLAFARAEMAEDVIREMIATDTARVFTDEGESIDFIRAIAAEETRVPTAWIVTHEKDQGCKPVTLSKADGWNIEAVSTTAPPQVPDSASVGDIVESETPASGATQCPDCRSTIKSIRQRVFHAGQPARFNHICNHSWHDFSPAADKTGSAK